MLKLQFLNRSHKKSYEDMLKNWVGQKAPDILFTAKDFEDFLVNVNADILWIEWKVPAHLFFLVDDEIKNEIIWAVQIRHHINHPNLIEAWWHIWYGISTKFRWKWYASKMLDMAKLEAKKLGIEKVSITCDISNIASNKVIQKNWWVFEKKVKEWTKNKYWLDIN